MKYQKNVYRSLVLITQFGINMIVPIFLCSFLGVFLDKKFGTNSKSYSRNHIKTSLTSFCTLLFFQQKFIEHLLHVYGILRSARKMVYEHERKVITA